MPYWILMLPTLNLLIFNDTAYKALSPNTITIDISGYTIAIVVIHSVNIGTASHTYVVNMHIAITIWKCKVSNGIKMKANYSTFVGDCFIRVYWTFTTCMNIMPGTLLLCWYYA